MLQIFNRGMECWRDFDTKYFKIDRKLREAAILKDKQEIIARINSDFQKLYFPKKADGTVCELEDMTYAEVARCGKKALFCNAILQSQKPNAFAKTGSRQAWERVEKERRFCTAGVSSSCPTSTAR